jgi:hypothetical protein
MSSVSGHIRGGAAVAGIAIVLLGLGGCAAGTSAEASGVDVGATTAATSPTTTSTTSAVSVIDLPTTSTTSAAPAAPQTTTSATQQPLSSIPPSPTPTACAFPEQFFVRIVSVGFDAGNSLHQIVAEPAQGLCGGGLPDDAEYTVTGPAVDYDVSPAVKITGIGVNGQPQSETWAQFASSDLNEYGGFYGIDVNGGVEVMVIDQYFHP